MSAAATASPVEDGARRAPGTVPVLTAGEAVRVATAMAAELAAGAAERDAERVLPGAELEALLREAGRAIDRADADLDEHTAALASLAVAAARASSTQASVEVSSRLFEVAGTRSAMAGLNLDRHWRNARTHTLHDPAAWKVQHLGRHAVDGTRPPNHGQL